MRRWVESRRHIGVKAEDIFPDGGIFHIPTHSGRFGSSKQMEESRSLTKHESAGHEVSGESRTAGQSRDEVWVRPYEQQRHGEEVSISGYWRPPPSFAA